MMDVMKFIKKHINAFVALGVIVLMGVALLLLKVIFFPNESKAIYGTRLEGRKDVEISEETKKKVQERVKDTSPKTEVRVAGRLIYITMHVNGDVNTETARNVGNSTLEDFSDAEKAYYDIQIIVENDANTNQFPIIGYKHHTKDYVSWTKDR